MHTWTAACTGATILLLVVHRLLAPSHAHSLHGHWSEAVLRAASSSSSTAAAADHPNNGFFLATAPLSFNQTLDHFAPQHNSKFPQRYFEFLDYFNPPEGPIFLFICGESTCSGIYNDYVGVLAKRFGAAIVSLEHRYYGFSSPFLDLKTENLKYLTSYQALYDLASFRNHYQDIVNKKYNLSRTSENAWITFGGSYSGALSAWFRLKFPHLTRGSIASSAVVHATQDFYQYDEQVARSVGLNCSLALQALKTIVNEYINEKNSTYVKRVFHAEAIEEDNDLLSLLADATALAVQYGFYQELCTPLVQAFNTNNSTKILMTYQDYINEKIYGDFGVSPVDYNRDHLKNTTLAGPRSGSRLWLYQICTEFGFLQTAPAKNSIRFSQLDEKYYLNLCQHIFGEQLYPRVDATNLYYGGDQIAGSKIFFTNGSQDPWQSASKQISSTGEPAFVIECKNCAHVVDLSGCPQFPFNPRGDASLCEPRDNIDLARKMIMEYIDIWIQG